MFLLMQGYLSKVKLDNSLLCLKIILIQHQVEIGKGLTNPKIYGNPANLGDRAQSYPQW